MEQLKKSKAWKSVTLYCEVFLKFLKAFFLLEDNVNNSKHFDKIVDADPKNFYKHDCAELSDFPELLDETKKFEIVEKHHS